ncbi:hypothetical protein OKW42_001599 [Paraburkholderia sp. WC7.3d]
MAAPTCETERRAHVFDTLPVPGVQRARQLTAFRRRNGILPGPAAKLPDALALDHAGRHADVMCEASEPPVRSGYP